MATTAPERKEDPRTNAPPPAPGRQLPESGDLILLLGVKTPPGQRGCTELHPIGSHHPAGIAIHHQKVRAIVVELVTIDPARQRSHPPCSSLNTSYRSRNACSSSAAFSASFTRNLRLSARPDLLAATPSPPSSPTAFLSSSPRPPERFPTFSPTTGSLPEHRISTTGEPPH